jgi:MFS family permease
VRPIAVDTDGRLEVRHPQDRATTTLLLATGGFFLSTLDILIVNVALTRIGRDLGGGTTALQWVIDGYTLLFATLLLSGGNLSDRIGAKRAFAVGWYGTVFLVSLYLQQHLGLPPMLAGLAFLPSAVVSLAGNLGSGPMTSRLGTRLPALLGLSSMTVGLIALMLVAPSGSLWPVAGLVILVGAGGSVAMPALIGVVLTSVPPHRAGIASAVLNMFRQIGGAVAIAVFGALIAAPRPFIPGLRTSFIIAAVLGGLASLACLGIRPRPDAGSHQ